MGQTLTNGIYLPDEGEVRCYAGLASNWTTLDVVVGGYRAHIANENIHITSAERNKWNNGVSQAYVLRYASVSLTALGTVAFSALDNTDNIKIGDKVLDSEGKLFALTAVDSANSTATLSALLIDLSKDSDLSNYYTKPETDTLLNDKADDSGVVHQSGPETIAGIKTFSDETFIKSLNFTNKVPSPSSSNSSIMPLITTITYGDSSPSVQARLNLRVTANGDKSFYPHENNQYSFGLTSRIFKEIYAYSYKVTSDINGINPGALSFPDLDNGLDISGYITDLTGASNINKYTPTVNGWISVGLSNAEFIELYIPSALMGGTFTKSSKNNYAQAFMPVIANKEVRISLKGASIGWAKFYPCQGNV